MINGWSGRAVSTWSLHRTLGSFVADDPELPMGMASGATTGPPPALTVVELAAELRARGYDTVQLCHFHLAHRDAAYLGEVRAAYAEAGITIDALLVDQGDLTHPTDADPHERWIHRWLDDAETLGARYARVIAGQAAPTPESLAASATRFGRLVREHPGQALVTENWFDLLPDAAAVDAWFDRVEVEVGFLIDLGNWTGPTVYDELARVAARAVTCHAKAHHDATGRVPDTEDYARTLTILRDAGFTGALALVYDGADADEWAGLDREHAVVRQVSSAAG